MALAPIEVLDSLLVYSPATDSWTSAWWNIFTQRGENKYKPIDAALSGENTIIPGVTGKRIVVTTFFFTVAGEVDITIKDGPINATGPMSFGGTGEPRGFVCNFYNNYLELQEGNAFILDLSTAIQVSGLATYKLK